MVTGVPGAPSRLIAPVLQANNSITRLPVSQSRPTAPQVTNISQSTQPGRSSAQTIQVKCRALLSNRSALTNVTDIMIRIVLF